METELSPSLATTNRRIRDVREALVRHERACLVTTEVDSKQDATFGFAAYALGILQELTRMENGTSILGRIGLRTLFESYVTLLHLKRSDDPALWITYRQYGSGQAKLAFLKLDSSGSSEPSSINLEILRQLANEDKWLEFVSIDLGHWAATDLRKLSEDCGVKADYDRLYPWTSAFTHGSWAAVRNSCFDLCINPLHRLHRRVRSDTTELGDVVPDACELVDKILDIVDDLYPGFKQRVTLQESRVAATGKGAPGASATQLVALATVQKEFFEILDEFFRRATGGPAEEFAPLDSFDETIQAQAERLNPRAPQALMFVHEALDSFYKRFAAHLYAEAKSLGGLKLVLGGTSRVGKSQLETVRKMLLYADSILIPDPILPWIESAREEERFRSVQLLEAAFFLLHFKPLIEADLPHIPIVIFPSFEKSLEERDATTLARMNKLFTGVLSDFLGHQFETFEQLRGFVTTRQDDFMRKVDEQKLFVGPGGYVGQPLREALDLYEAEIKHWRSESYQKTMGELPKGALLLVALVERLAPHYHLLENARELSSCPLIALQAHWHYFSQISRFFATQLQAQGSLDVHAMNAMDLMQKPQQKWLGGIPFAHLADLLSNRENERFRLRLGELVSELRKASVANLNRIVPEVCEGLVSLSKEHDADIQAIQEKYKSRYGDGGVAAYVTGGATYMQMLAPSTRIPDQSKADQLRLDEVPERKEKQNDPANSLLGIMAPGSSN